MSTHNTRVKASGTEWAVGLGQGARQGQGSPVGEPQSEETAALESARLSSLTSFWYVHDLQLAGV